MDEKRPVGAAQNSAKDEIEQLLKQDKDEQALSVLRKHWLVNPTDVGAIDLAAQIMSKRGNAELANNLQLLSKEGAIEQDLQNLFEAAFKLIDERELQLATMLLQRCEKLCPEDSLINYELGFSLMSTHQFKDAIQYFEKSAKDSNDFDTRLNLSVCYLMTRQLDRARDMMQAMSELAANDEELKEVALRRDVLKRMEKFQGKKKMSPRDWLFCLYGTLLLDEPDITVLPPHLLSEKPTQPAAPNAISTLNNPTYADIAWTLVVLQHSLNELGYDFDVIEYYSPLSRPLAEALSHIMELPVQSYRGPDFPDRALLVMAWAPNIIGPHKSFAKNSNKRMMFAYALPFAKPLPLTPDIVGQLSASCTMPWAASSSEEADLRGDMAMVDLPDEEQAVAMEKILERVHDMQSRPDLIHTVQEIVSYYRPKKEMLVAGNAQHYSERPEYTAEIIY